MALNLNDPRYEELLELQKLIEQKEEEIKVQQFELEKASSMGISPGGQISEEEIRPTAPRFDLEQNQNIYELNNLISQQTEMEADLYHSQLNKVEPKPELLTNEEELETPTEPYAQQFTEQDLINSYRGKLGNSYTDKQILDYVSFVNPEQYNAVVGIPEEEQPIESPGIWDITKNAWNQAWESEKITKEYYTPAFQLGEVGIWNLAGSSPTEMDFNLKKTLRLLPEYSNASEQELDSAISQIKGNGNVKDNVIKSLLAEGENRLDESSRNDEEALAIAKYLDSSDGWLFYKNVYFAK